jgi:hypothetical protein
MRERVMMARWFRKLWRMLEGEDPAYHIRGFLESNLGCFPPLEACWFVAQPMKYHRGRTVGEHTLLALESAGEDPLVRLAVLFHDVGKIRENMRIYRGRTTFIQHEKRGAIIAENYLKSVSFSDENIEKVRWLIRNHDVGEWDKWNLVRKVDVVNNPDFASLVVLRMADIMGQNKKLNRLYGWMEKVHAIDDGILFWGKKPFALLNSPSGETLDQIIRNRLGIKETIAGANLAEKMRTDYINGKYNSRLMGLTRLKDHVRVPRLPD